MAYDFSFVRLQRDLQVAFPAALDSFEHNPLAGPFSPQELAAFSARVEQLPNVRRISNDRDYFELDDGGFLSIWVTSDGGVYLESQAGLELVLQLFRDLKLVNPELVLEDPQLGLLHDMGSFAAWVGGGALLSAQGTVQVGAAA
jgi:hypothetical protein